MSTMPLEEKTKTSSPGCGSDDERKSESSVDDAKPDEAKGGMGPYLVGLSVCGIYAYLTL